MRLSIPINPRRPEPNSQVTVGDGIGTTSPPYTAHAKSPLSLERSPIRGPPPMIGRPLPDQQADCFQKIPDALSTKNATSPTDFVGKI